MSLSSLEGGIEARSFLPGWDDPETTPGMEEFEEAYRGGDDNDGQSTSDGPEPKAERHQYNLSDYDIVQAFIRGARMRTDGLLSRQQETGLSYTIQQGLSAKEKLLEDAENPDLGLIVRDGMDAEEILVAGNALLVVKEARAFMRKRRVLESNLEELVAQGLLGLAIAARNYTDPRKAKFASFAKPTINKFIRSADMSVFGSAAYFDRNDRESVLPSLFATNTRLTNQLGRSPTMEELSAEFNDYHAKKRAETGEPVPRYLIMNPERASAMMRIMNPWSMEAPVKADTAEDETDLRSLLPDTSEHADTAETAVANILTAEAHSLLMAALSSLPDEKQRRILLLTFQFGVDPDEGNVLHDNGKVSSTKIAKLLGIKQQYISHLRGLALKQLAQNPALRDFWASFRQA